MRISQFITRYPLVVITLIVGLGAFTCALGGANDLARWLASGWVIVVVGLTAIEMIKDIVAGHWGLDILAVVAMVATIAVGEYFAGLVIALMLTGGEALEDYAAQRAGRELDALLDRAPQSANRIDTNGDIRTISAEEVRVGDVLIVRSAEVLPVDGILLSKEAELDESSLTGESMPVVHRRGQEVFSGTVNGSLTFRMRATATAADSQYASIVALVREAVESKAPLVRLADRYAVPFTIVSLAIAALAWWLSGDPTRFAEVLVVATPCPLLIAAPVAFMGGMSRAATSGIIVKDATTLEILSRIRTAAFDKTGTLTSGRPVIEAIETRALDEAEVLGLAAAAEQYSVHVLAQAITATATAGNLRLPQVETAEEIASNGVRVRLVDGRRVVVGKASFVQQATATFPPASLQAGQSAVYIGLDGHLVGTIILADPLRTNAGATIAALTQLGVRELHMLTGDIAPTARAIGNRVGIAAVQAECSPQEKVEALAQMPNRPVMMVGDGINDAPVLAAADVGIAMGARGATAASQSAAAVITSDDLSAVAHAVQISQRTVRIAIESIWLGIIISVGLMAVAAWGFLPAIIGAAMQEVVDLVAIVGALRALKPGKDEHGDLTAPVRLAPENARCDLSAADCQRNAPQCGQPHCSRSAA
ncbi:MAG: heavy metal translocating P-type ATPase [Bowdeniella nasicola]|nr:heavy metal translocating P-type ATPase [Bowdeniella nasicola]